jgi:ATP-dependent Zn protease
MNRRSSKAEQQQESQQVFVSFFDMFKYEDAKQQLTNCIETCLSTDNEHYDTALTRANLLCFYHMLEEVLDAAHNLRRK